MSEMTTVPELLRRTLDAQGMTQAELADATGLSTKHINQLLQGDIDLSPRCAWRIGHAIGVPGEVWLTLQALHSIRRAADAEPLRGDPVTPKLRRELGKARAEVKRLRRIVARMEAPDA